MLPHFNAALDELRGTGTERELARKLEISEDALVRYRRGDFPKNVRRLTRFPALFEALANDARATAADDQQPIGASA